jgi:hypothetical protein
MVDSSRTVVWIAGVNGESGWCERDPYKTREKEKIVARKEES